MQIILVSGAGNSGKTSSIRLFLKNRRIFFPDSPRDISLVLPIQKKDHTYLVGVASGGDTLEIVEDNFRFFSNYPCDIIICASKSRGETVDRIQAMGNEPNNQLMSIFTNRINPFDPVTAAADNARVAAEIESNIS